MVEVVNGRTFDRVPEPSQNANYPIRALLEERREITRTRIHWRHGLPLDQGPDGACVGFGWTGDLLASPVRVNLSTIRVPTTWTVEPNGFAKQVYLAAQQIDEWPGGEYEGAKPRYSGTSVVAGAKEIQSLGFMDSYRWCFSTTDVRDALLAHGPVVIGVAWRESMFDPDPATYRLTVEGSVAGGHCVLLNAYEPDRDFGDGPGSSFRLQNSWGGSWGTAGGAWLTEADLDTLLSDDGDAAVPVGRHYGTPLS